MDTLIPQWVKDILPLLIPILLIQLGLVVFAMVDFARRKNVRGPRWAWWILLILGTFSFPFGVLVAGVYLGWGRHAEEAYDSN